MIDPRHSWNQPAAALAKRTSKADPRPSKSPRWAMLNAFIDHQMRHLSGPAIAVWLVLYRETNREGLSRITVEQIVEKTGLGTTSAKKGLKELKALKLIVQVRRGCQRSGPSTHRLLPIETVGHATQSTRLETVAPAPLSTQIETVALATQSTRKRAIETDTRAPTASVAHAPPLQKEQEHRPPLGASAVHSDGEKEARTLSITAGPDSSTDRTRARGGR